MTSPFGADVRLLAVDLDGTLVDSAPDLNYCLGFALESVALPRPSEAQTRSWIGDGIEELIRRALANAARDHATSSTAPETFKEAFASFSACYEKNLFTRSRLYPRVAETLDALRERGIRLCCITNKRIGFARGLLEQAGIIDRFELVLGGDSLAQKKPSPLQLHAAAEQLAVRSSSAALAGDSFHDFHAAKAADWSFIWARYGYCARIDAGPGDAVVEIEEFSELIHLLPGEP